MARTELPFNLNDFGRLVAALAAMEAEPLVIIAPRARPGRGKLLRRIFIRRGGPGSGHFGHKGRPGLRGGSLPSGKAKSGSKGGQRRHPRRRAVAQEDRPYSQEAHRLAVGLRRQAAAIEPGVTASLSDIARATGSRLAGLEFRLKTLESLAQKIEREAERLGLDREQVANEEIHDVLRYTLVWDDSHDYLHGVEKAIAALRELGWEIYDHRVRNYWAPGDDYDGYNTVWVEPSAGQRVEIQFHTAQSIQSKERSHVLYEQARLLPANAPERQRLLRAMAEIWQTVQRPSGWERLPGVRMDAVSH